jgi:NTP pyrophosphatase (non-canonical NTP hydrolase)
VNKDLKRIIAAWGDEQKKIAIEELAELITAILHFERNKISKQDLISEVADVEIMLKQLKIIYDLPQEEVEKEMRFKLNRTIKKLDGDK